jgi:hypothetical protein
MGYRAILEATSETVQDTTLSATRRLDEALTLFVHGQYHSSIYLGGLSAEMFLKSACFMLGGAQLADPVSVHLTPLRDRRYDPPFKADFESGHGLWFWSQEFIGRRSAFGRRPPTRFLRVLASIYADWFIGMRYRPGFATSDDAAMFLHNVEWIANNYGALRR